jgi:hypothetical protein
MTANQLVAVVREHVVGACSRRARCPPPTAPAVTWQVGRERLLRRGQVAANRRVELLLLTPDLASEEALAATEVGEAHTAAGSTPSMTS